MSESKRVVIVGGGFAGVKCARVLRKKLRRSGHEVVIFNRENHMVFHPMLAEVAGGSLNPDAVAAPLRQMLPGVRCRTEDVSSLDLEKSELTFESHDGRLEAMSYDHVVLACGSVTNLGMVPGMADHAFPLKTVGDAVALRAHVMQQLEKAEVFTEEAKRRWYLTFIVVGGGYSGVEAAGEINDLAHGSVRFFHSVKRSDISVKIIHSREQLLPEIGERLREFTREKMEKAGIEMLLGARCAVATPEGVVLNDGREIKGGTVICTIGTSPSPVIQKLDVPKERGRPVTEPDMRISGTENAWAIGDCAHIINAFDEKPSPPTGQFAERQGRQAAENIVRVVRGETVPFRFKVLGQLCSIGGHSAVAEIMGMRLSGFLAWFLWRGIYLMKMPSWSRRIRVGFDWFWQLIFSRDLSHLKTDKTERVASAYYRAGDYIFRQGDPAADFYVVEKGEVEILREGDGDDAAVLAVLSAGDFFGEMALITNQPRNASVRARTDVEVVVMGKHVFAQVSRSLTPLEDLLTGAVRRREASRWDSSPAAQAVLEATPLSEFVTSLPEVPFRPEDTFAEAVSRFQRDRLDFGCVVDDDGALVGILSRAHFVRALQDGIGRDSQVRDFVDAAPVSIAATDTSLAAAGTMRDHGLTWVPVVDDCRSRKAVGFVDAQAILARIVDGLPAGAE